MWSNMTAGNDDSTISSGKSEAPIHVNKIYFEDDDDRSSDRCSDRPHSAHESRTIPLASPMPQKPRRASLLTPFFSISTRKKLSVISDMHDAEFDAPHIPPLNMDDDNNAEEKDNDSTEEEAPAPSFAYAPKLYEGRTHRTSTRRQQHIKQQEQQDLTTPKTPRTLRNFKSNSDHVRSTHLSHSDHLRSSSSMHNSRSRPLVPLEPESSFRRQRSKPIQSLEARLQRVPLEESPFRRKGSLPQLNLDGVDLPGVPLNSDIRNNHYRNLHNHYQSLQDLRFLSDEKTCEEQSIRQDDLSVQSCARRAKAHGMKNYIWEKAEEKSRADRVQNRSEKRRVPSQEKRGKDKEQSTSKDVRERRKEQNKGGDDGVATGDQNDRDDRIRSISRSKSRGRGREMDKGNNRNSDREKDKTKDRDKTKSRHKDKAEEKDLTTTKSRTKEKDKTKERSRAKDTDRGKERAKEKERNREKERNKEKDRGKEKGNDRDNDTDKDRRRDRSRGRKRDKESNMKKSESSGTMRKSERSRTMKKSESAESMKKSESSRTMRKSESTRTMRKSESTESMKKSEHRRSTQTSEVTGSLSPNKLSSRRDNKTRSRKVSSSPPRSRHGKESKLEDKSEENKLEYNTEQSKLEDNSKHQSCPIDRHEDQRTRIRPTSPRRSSDTSVLKIKTPSSSKRSSRRASMSVAEKITSRKTSSSPPRTRHNEESRLEKNSKHQLGYIDCHEDNSALKTKTSSSSRKSKRRASMSSVEKTISRKTSTSPPRTRQNEESTLEDSNKNQHNHTDQKEDETAMMVPASPCRNSENNAAKIKTPSSSKKASRRASLSSVEKISSRKTSTPPRTRLSEESKIEDDHKHEQNHSDRLNNESMMTVPQSPRRSSDNVALEIKTPMSSKLSLRRASLSSGVRSRPSTRRVSSVSPCIRRNKTVDWDNRISLLDLDYTTTDKSETKDGNTDDTFDMDDDLATLCSIEFSHMSFNSDPSVKWFQDSKNSGIASIDLDDEESLCFDSDLEDSVGESEHLRSFHSTRGLSDILTLDGMDLR